MKRYAALVLLLLLSLTACASDSTPTEATMTTTASSTAEAPAPEEGYDLVYDMSNYQWFADIFAEKSSDEWNGMGRYTMLLEGLHTPVVLEMEGQEVLSVSAYGHRKEVHIGLFEEVTPMDIRATKDAVVVNEDLDYNGRTWIFTTEKCFEYVPEGDISIQVRLNDDDTMVFTRYWGEYLTTFNQDEYAPLYQCTSRDHFLYEKGTAEIVDGELMLAAEKTVVVSDEYDLDALFAEAKAQGLFEEYDTVDALLEANKVRG